MLRLLYRRLLHVYDNLGWRGLLGLRRMPGIAEPNPRPHPFDLARGTDTSGFQPGEALSSGSPSDLYSTAYYGISPSTLAQALTQIPAALDGYSFVDLGCGKGRALLVAADLAFTAVLGVEIIPDLCDIARRNVAPDPRIAVLNQDAANVTYPPTPLVVFLYHPFLKPVVRRALANLERQLRERPRPAWLLYANPSYPRLLARFRFLEEVWERDLPLSEGDRAADRHEITHERYTLYRAVLSPRE